MLARVILFLVLFCPSPIYGAECEEKELYCSMPAQTRTINGIDVHRDCWQYKYKLNCGTTSQNDCNKISPNNCTFVEEECTSKMKEGDLEFCTNYKRHYACEKQIKYEEEKAELLRNGERADGQDLMCNLMCLDGECSAVKKVNDDEDQDLAHSIAMMNALKDAKNGIEGNILVSVFKGKAEECSKKKVGYMNCCNLAGGWGQLLGAKCGGEVQNLAKKRKEKKCVEVGKYCSFRLLGLVCLVEKTAFCCYDSVIAKIINQEAKRQLGRNNGTAENPQCGGLTLEDFKNVDLSKVDFKEFYDEVVIPNLKIPDIRIEGNSKMQDAQKIIGSAENLSREKQGFNPEVLNKGVQ